MRAYTVYLPYAEATMKGLKNYETRPMPTKYRGRVAVHVAKKIIKDHALYVAVHEMLFPNEKYDGSGMYYAEHGISQDYGAVIGTVEIIGCVPTEDIVDRLPEREKLLGDFSPGRFAWVLRKPERFTTPVPAKGQQGWWNWEGGGGP